jgi:hypothetical protein
VLVQPSLRAPRRVGGDRLRQVFLGTAVDAIALVVADLDDFVVQRAFGDRNLDPLAFFLPQQTLADGTGDQIAAGIVIFVAGADQGEFFFVAVVQVLDDDGRAEGDFVTGQIGSIDDAGAGQFAAELVDFGLQQALSFPLRVVFGVFLEIVLDISSCSRRSTSAFLRL